MSDMVPCYKRHRFPPAIIAPAVWLYLRFSLSLRAVEERLLERGIEVFHETLRRWVVKFGPVIAGNLRQRQARPGKVWHLDEVRVSVRGHRFWLWRAVDERGLVREELLQPRRDAKAAKRPLRCLLKTMGQPPKRLVTDKLRSYAAARRAIAPGLEHRSHNALATCSGPTFQCHAVLTRKHASWCPAF